MSLRSRFRSMRIGAPVVVVSGLPRSGTSMAMRMLAAGGMPLLDDGARAADEDNPRGYFEDTRVTNLAQDRDKQWLRDARGKAIKVISYLLLDLPAIHDYRILFMNRDLHEVLASQAKMLARRGEISETSDERMLENFQNHLARVKAAIRNRSNFQLCEVEYAAVLETPRRGAEIMQEFVGRTLDIDAMTRAVEPSCTATAADSDVIVQAPRDRNFRPRTRGRAGPSKSEPKAE